MAVTVDEALVVRLASLANLELSQGEAEALTRDLAGILEYVAILEEAPVPGGLLSGSGPPPTFMRADEPKPSLARDVALREAPRAAEGGFAVPAFVDDAGGPGRDGR